MLNPNQIFFASVGAICRDITSGLPGQRWNPGLNRFFVSPQTIIDAGEAKTRRVGVLMAALSFESASCKEQ